MISLNKDHKVLWFTGLSGSGKTTIANELKRRLELTGKKVEILDGDVIRSTVNRQLGFSREDIRENNRLIAELAKQKLQEHDLILVPIIAPYHEDRIMARNIIGPAFFEVFINAPLEQCIKKDVKGLYKLALSGEIKDFIGIAESNPYEPPKNPDLEVTTVNRTVRQSVERIFNFLSQNY
ncbi:adenylyl-sulfate kinase [Candidatus Woesearchaeota archaeon]|nr:adenylyl-sulfate kinase [Candidatus Woesearchaeota archaeon]